MQRVPEQNFGVSYFSNCLAQLIVRYKDTEKPGIYRKVPFDSCLEFYKSLDGIAIF